MLLPGHGRPQGAQADGLGDDAAADRLEDGGAGAKLRDGCRVGAARCAACPTASTAAPRSRRQ